MEYPIVLPTDQNLKQWRKGQNWRKRWPKWRKHNRFLWRKHSRPNVNRRFRQSRVHLLRGADVKDRFAETHERKQKKREADMVRWFCKHPVDDNPLEIMVVDMKY